METVVGTEFTTPRLTKTFERSFKMSSEYIKHNGQRKKKSEVISRGKKYKYYKTGKLVEIGGVDPDTGATVVQGADDFVIGGTKSSLRRIADIRIKRCDSLYKTNNSRWSNSIKYRIIRRYFSW